MIDLLGTWTLLSCVSQRGDKERRTFADKVKSLFNN